MACGVSGDRGSDRGPKNDPPKGSRKLGDWSPGSLLLLRCLVLGVLSCGGRPGWVSLFYDVNALSNFVTDAERIVGFNPYKMLVDFLADQIATLGSSIEAHRVEVPEKI